MHVFLFGQHAHACCGVKVAVGTILIRVWIALQTAVVSSAVMACKTVICMLVYDIGTSVAKLVFETVSGRVMMQAACPALCKLSTYQ